MKIANIAKNTSYFTLALILQKVISFTYFTIYARQLGPADLGKYYFALSMTTVFSLAVDLGVVNLITREIAKEQTKARELLAAGLGLKIILAVATSALLGLKIIITGYDPLIAGLIMVAGVSMLMDAFTALLFGISRACHNLKYESVVAVASQAITLVISLLILKLNWGLVALMWAQVACPTRFLNW